MQNCILKFSYGALGYVYCMISRNEFNVRLQINSKFYIVMWLRYIWCDRVEGKLFRHVGCMS